MCIIQVLFFLFSFIHSESCQVHFCADNIPLRFPFQLHGKLPENCSYPGFNLTCSSQGITVLKLPNSGEFFVRNINYITQQIYLYDPEDCLPKRLQSFNLSGSPFVATFVYHNYTFLSCPAQLTKSRFTTIDCLSNSTTSVLASSSVSFVNSMISSCQIISTLTVPISRPVHYDEGFIIDLNSDLPLTWSLPECIDCEARGQICGFKSRNSQEIGCFNNPKPGGSNGGLQVFRILALSIAIPALICAAAIGICACCTDRSRLGSMQLNSTPTAVVPQPPIMTVGLDESTIESFQKLVIGESKRLPGPNSSACPICLSEYLSQETIRCIPECKHCFHAECIDEWLRLNDKCPVCRNSATAGHASSVNP
ncbi:hypothetical protein AB3S75_025666 [Citrus x aurantiifolia]